MKKPYIEGSEINSQVYKRLEKYKSLDFLGQYAMFMGMAQVLEFRLKCLLSSLYKYDIEQMGKWTLGKTTRELKKNKLRADFISLLESVVEYRNYIAHELLVNEALLRNILDNNSGRLEIRNLEKGIYELEKIIFLFDWCEENSEWN